MRRLSVRYKGFYTNDPTAIPNVDSSLLAEWKTPPADKEEWQELSIPMLSPLRAIAGVLIASLVLCVLVACVFAAIRGRGYLPLAMSGSKSLASMDGTDARAVELRTTPGAATRGPAGADCLRRAREHQASAQATP